jgi:hypothetical protein
MVGVVNEALPKSAKDALSITTYKKAVSFLSEYFKAGNKTILDI